MRQVPPLFHPNPTNSGRKRRYRRGESQRRMQRQANPEGNRQRVINSSKKRPPQIQPRPLPLNHDSQKERKVTSHQRNRRPQKKTKATIVMRHTANRSSSNRASSNSNNRLRSFLRKTPTAIIKAGKTAERRKLKTVRFVEGGSTARTTATARGMDFDAEAPRPRRLHGRGYTATQLDELDTGLQPGVGVLCRAAENDQGEGQTILVGRVSERIGGVGCTTAEIEVELQRWDPCRDRRFQVAQSSLYYEWIFREVSG
jgi:hypothetical protein